MKSEEALEQIAYLKELTVKTRLIAAYGYPFYILWGITVLIGYLGSFIFSTHLVWYVTVMGVIISFFIGLKRNKQNSANRLLKQIGLQSLILVISGIFVFIYIFKYKDYITINAFPSFQFGIIYLIVSVHMGRDVALVGLWMVLSSIISLALAIPFQDIWLGITIGGGLIFTGFLFKYQIKKAGDKIVE